MWRAGHKLVHPFNPELGIGVVRGVEGRFLEVEFPEVGRELRMAAEASGLEPLRLQPGDRARLIETAEEVVVAHTSERGYRLADGREVDEPALWPLAAVRGPLERLGALDLDPPESFLNRVAGLRLRALREAGGLGSFLGGRIELFPHQLYTALRATERDPVRWLLADEVGLGKTIEACLILSALVRTRRAERALIAAPRALTVQWLGELYRKFHQVFVLLDAPRIESVARDIGPDANPFDVHPLGVVATEDLEEDPELARRALDVELDLLVIDEAHRLEGEGPYRALAPLARASHHLLLLSAVPLWADPEAMHRLLELLHPESFPSAEAFRADLAAGRARVPCTSSVRRADLGGLPPRVARAIDLDAPSGELGSDARTRWIVSQVPGWLERGEKALVFVSGRDELEALQEHIERTARTRITAFHEGLSSQARDIQVARFRETRAPLLLCSEAGAEGRNFQFCERVVHWDLPDDPIAIEQRIGRLDRIGRTRPVEVVYFRHARANPDVAGLYERLELFTRPSAGLDAALGGVRGSIAQARETGEALDAEALAERVASARAAAERDAPRVLFPDAYHRELAPDILARIPADLEPRCREFCVGAAENLGFDVVPKGGTAQFFFELAREGRVDSLPGVPGGARFLGSFDRAESVRREEVDFFASGHPLVEGLLLELEDGTRGRTAAFELRAQQCGFRGMALWLALECEGRTDWALVDADGRPQPRWLERVLELGPAAARPLSPEIREALSSEPRWRARLAELARAATPETATATAAAWLIAR